MDFSTAELALMLGVTPDINTEDVTIIIKHKKTGNIINQLDINELYEGLIKLPVDLSKIN